MLSKASTVCNYFHAGTKQTQGRCRGPHLADAPCDKFMKPNVSLPLVTSVVTAPNSSARGTNLMPSCCKTSVKLPLILKVQDFPKVGIC